VLIMQFQNEAGQVQKLQRNLQGTVAAGSQQLFDLGLTGKLTPVQLKTLQARIAGAEVAR
jgi:hypothetical protein